MPVNAVELFALLLCRRFLPLAHRGFHGVQPGFQLSAHGADMLSQTAGQSAHAGVDALSQSSNGTHHRILGLCCSSLLLLPKTHLQLLQLRSGDFRVQLLLELGKLLLQLLGLFQSGLLLQNQKRRCRQQHCQH